MLYVEAMLKHLILLILCAACSVYCNVTSSCEMEEVSGSYLDVAIDMITRAKTNIPKCNNCSSESINVEAKDCADVLQFGHTKSGVYEIWPVNRMTENKAIEVYCDMDTDGGGWTVFQRRGNFKRPKDFFYKDWKSYKEGFGHIEKDFWLGNDNIFAISNQKVYSVRFDMKDVEQNKRYALYDKFWIDDEIHKYTLHVANYSGDAGDSVTREHNNQKFSTKDQENDHQPVQFCAELYKGGWWYGGCHDSNLNGLYLHGKHESFADGVNWLSWKGYHESLEWTEIKMRPRKFIPSSFSSFKAKTKAKPTPTSTIMPSSTSKTNKQSSSASELTPE